MSLHRDARRSSVAAGNRFEDRTVLAQRRPPQLRRIVVMLELLVQRSRTLLPQHLDHLHQCPVAGCLGDAQMEQTIGPERLSLGLHFLLHQAKRLFNGGDLSLSCRFGSQRCALAFHDPPSAQQLERSRSGLHFTAFFVGRTDQHVDARSDANLDQPLDFQCNEGLAHAWPRHAELLGQIAFRRQARTGRELS